MNGPTLRDISRCALDRPTRVSLALAVVAHVVALVAVRPVRDKTVTEAVPQPLAVETLDVEMIAPAVPQPETHAAPIVAQAAPVLPMPKPLAHLTTVVPPPPGPSSSAPSEVTTPAPSGSGDIAKAEPQKPVIPPLFDLSAPGKHTFILPPSSSGKPMTKEEAVAAKLDASIKGTLDAKDQVVDGGYGGPVVSAAHAAASGINAPQVGYATFDIETDNKGVVTTVRLVDYGGDLGWQRVQKELQANLSTQTLKVPKGANGVHVRVRVEADMKLPSGAKKKIEDPGIEGIGFGFKFDVADIGATKHRVVGVKLVEQHRL